MSLLLCTGVAQSMGHEKECQIEPGEFQPSGHLLRKEMPRKLQEWPELGGGGVQLESVTCKKGMFSPMETL